MGNQVRPRLCRKYVGPGAFDCGAASYCAEAEADCSFERKLVLFSFSPVVPFFLSNSTCI